MAGRCMGWMLGAPGFLAMMGSVPGCVFVEKSDSAAHPDTMADVRESLQYRYGDQSARTGERADAGSAARPADTGGRATDSATVDADAGPSIADRFVPKYGSYFRIGTGWVDVGSGPRAGYGTLTNGMNEHFMGKVGDDMRGWEVRGGIGIPSPTPERRQDVDRWRGTLGNFYDAGFEQEDDHDWYPPAHPFYPHGPMLFLDMFYGEADDDIHVTEPVGGRNFAFTYPNLESPSGATGVNFGMTGGTLDAQVDYSWFGVELGAEFHRPIAERTLLTFRPSFNYRRSEWDYNARATSTTFTDSYMDVDEQIDEDRVGIRLDLRATRGLVGGLYGFLGGGIGGSYGDADWDSRHAFHVPVNPNPADQMFHIDLSDSKDYFALDAGGEIGLGYARGRFSIEATLGLDWTSDVPEIDNAASPNDSPAHLDTTEQTTTRIMLEAGYRF